MRDARAAAVPVTFALATLLGCAPAGVSAWIVALDGRVVDASGRPVEGAEVALATLAGEYVGAPMTDADGAWTWPLAMEVAEGNRLAALVHADGYADGRATFVVNMPSAPDTTLSAAPEATWQGEHRRVPAVVLAEDATEGSVIGTVRDALIATPVSGLALRFRHGANARDDDPVVGEAVTDGAGGWTYTASPPGMYTVSVAAGGGYAAARFGAFLTAEGTTADGWVSGPLAVGQFRATLGWNSSADLDLHVSAPLKGGQAGASGNGQYHIWAQEPTHPDKAASDGSYEAEMMALATAAPGGETAEIHDQPGVGEIRVSAFDMSDRSDKQNPALADASARLQVWYGEADPEYFEICPGEIATLWRPTGIDVASAVYYGIEEYSVGAQPGDAGAF